MRAAAWCVDRLTVCRRFCLEIGWLYTRLVASYSASEDAIVNVGQRPRLQATVETQSLLPLTRDGRVELNYSVGDFMAMCVRSASAARRG